MNSSSLLIVKVNYSTCVKISKEQAHLPMNHGLLMYLSPRQWYNVTLVHATATTLIVHYPHRCSTVTNQILCSSFYVVYLDNNTWPITCQVNRDVPCTLVYKNARRSFYTTNVQFATVLCWKHCILALYFTRKPCCRRETARCRCKFWSIPSLLALCWSNISQSNAVSQWMHRVCVNTVCLKKQKNMYY